MTNEKALAAWKQMRAEISEENHLFVGTINPEMVDLAIEALERDRWISVEERLPEPHTRVIGFMAWKSIMTVEYQNGHWYNIDHLEHMPDEAVTHWMPLPEPPKEEHNAAD